MKLSLVVLLGALTLGFSSVAQAELKWVETVRGFCPEVCQNTNYQFAVPSGIHKKTGKTYYICAVNYGMGDIGWRAGYNIAWDKQSCFAQWHKLNSGKGSYQEHYLCLCSNQEIPPIKDNTEYIKRRR
jgi:hypothetical protein